MVFELSYARFAPAILGGLQCYDHRFCVGLFGFWGGSGNGKYSGRFVRLRLHFGVSYGLWLLGLTERQ